MISPDEPQYVTIVSNLSATSSPHSSSANHAIFLDCFSSRIGGQGSHAAHDFITPTLADHRRAGTLLYSGQEAADHHAAGPNGTVSNVLQQCYARGTIQWQS